MSRQTFYKVISDDARAFSGGSFDYAPYLPTQTDGEWTPGEWTPKVSGKVEACVKGYHLTLAPAIWWNPGARCFVAEHDGECSKLHDGEKIACRSIRLLREVTDHAELAAVNVFMSGSHEIRSVVGIALGSSSVVASYVTPALVVFVNRRA